MIYYTRSNEDYTFHCKKSLLDFKVLFFKSPIRIAISMPSQIELFFISQKRIEIITFGCALANSAIS